MRNLQGSHDSLARRLSIPNSLHWYMCNDSASLFNVVIWYLIVQKWEYIPHNYRLVKTIQVEENLKRENKNLEDKKHEMERKSHKKNWG